MNRVVFKAFFWSAVALIYQPCFLNVAGSFVVVDESGKEKALESGSKVACLVSQVLFSKQVRELEKSPEWCAIVSSFDFCIFIWFEFPC